MRLWAMPMVGSRAGGRTAIAAVVIRWLHWCASGGTRTRLATSYSADPLKPIGFVRPAPGVTRAAEGSNRWAQVLVGEPKPQGKPSCPSPRGHSEKVNVDK